MRTSLISSALGAHAKRTTGGKTGRGEPGSTVQLRNGESRCVSDQRDRCGMMLTDPDPTISFAYVPPIVFGTPTSAMEGLKDRAVPAHRQERER